MHTGDRKVRRNTRPSLRNGFTAYSALSLETNSSCLHRWRIDDPPKPGWARQISISLTPATGARTTRLCRPRLPPPKPFDRLMCCRPKFRRRRLSAGRLRAGRSLTGRSPPCNPSRARRCRVHRIPHPTSVTIAIRPSWWDGMRGVVRVIWVNHEAEYFFGRDWTGQIKLTSLKKFARPRTRRAAV